MVTTTEFDELIEVLRDFIRSEVMPAEAGIDESDEIPDRLITQAKEMGLYGYALPSEFGGLGRGLALRCGRASRQAGGGDEGDDRAAARSWS